MKTLKELQLDYHRETDLAFDTARAAWIAGASAAEAHLIYKEIANPAKDIFMVEYSALTDRNRLGS